MFSSFFTFIAGTATALSVFFFSQNSHSVQIQHAQSSPSGSTHITLHTSTFSSATPSATPMTQQMKDEMQAKMKAASVSASAQMEQGRAAAIDQVNRQMEQAQKQLSDMQKEQPALGTQGQTMLNQMHTNMENQRQSMVQNFNKTLVWPKE